MSQALDFERIVELCRGTSGPFAGDSTDGVCRFREDVQQPDGRRSWQAARLGDVVRLVSGRTPSKKREAFWNGAIPWVSAKDMRRFRLRDTMDHVTPEGLANGTRQVPAGTTLLLTRGMRLLKELPVCVVERPMAFNQDVKALLPNARIDPRFLPYLILGNEQRLQDLVDLSGHGTGRINSDELRVLDIRLPPTREQRAIAAVLSDVDELIGSLEALIAKKRAIKQAAMQELLTGGTRLPGFGGEWETVAIGDVADIKNGGTPRTGVPAYWGGRIPWCVPTDITASRGKYLVTTARQITTEGLASCGASLLPSGSLLLCSRATIGEIKIASIPVATNQGFKSMVCGASVDNGFLYYRLVTLKERMIDLAAGSTFLEISKRDVANIHIDLPPLPEQRAIATILSDMDAEIAALERRLDKTRVIKQGMMQQLLTGSIRLPIPDDDTEDDDAHDA